MDMPNLYIKYNITLSVVFMIIFYVYMFSLVSSSADT